MRRERSRPRLPLKILTRGGGGELTRISIDTTVGMIFSNVIAYFIILATRARCMRMASQTFKQPATRQKPCDPSLEISPSCSLRWGSLALAYLRSRCPQAVWRLCSSRTIRMAFDAGG